MRQIKKTLGTILAGAYISAMSLTTFGYSGTGDIPYKNTEQDAVRFTEDNSIYMDSQIKIIKEEKIILETVILTAENKSTGEVIKIYDGTSGDLGDEWTDCIAIIPKNGKATVYAPRIYHKKLTKSLPPLLMIDDYAIKDISPEYLDFFNKVYHNAVKDRIYQNYLDEKRYVRKSYLKYLEKKHLEDVPMQLP